jgi:hypothetical protein
MHRGADLEGVNLGMDVMRGYVRNRDLFRDYAGDGIL